MENVLLVVGNGFDLAHRLPTSYSEFKQMLVKKQSELIINRAVEERNINDLCDQIKKMGISINISEKQIAEALEKNSLTELVSGMYRDFLSELHGKLYSGEFMEEKWGFVPENEMDNEMIQQIIRKFDEIIDCVYGISNACKRYKEICVTNNECSDEIDKIEFILRTFDINVNTKMYKSSKIIMYNFFNFQSGYDL